MGHSASMIWHIFPRQYFQMHLLENNVIITIDIPIKFVPKGPTNNIATFVQVMAWLRPGDKPLAQPRMVRLQRHIWVTRPKWFNTYQLDNIFKCIFLHGKKWFFAKISLMFVISNWGETDNATEMPMSYPKGLSWHIIRGFSGINFRTICLFVS